MEEATVLNQCGRTNTMLVCISSWRDSIACGELFSCYCEEPRSFTGFDQLLFIMEDLLDRYNQAPRWYELRRLNHPPKRRTARQEFVSPTIKPKLARASDRLLRIRGKVCTIAVTVYCRQNASMQGRFRVLGKGENNFRSALELLHLFRAALTSVPIADKK